MKNRFTDYGNSKDNGMATTQSERAVSWLDVDGSAAGHAGWPSILGAGVEETGEWWRLDEYCMFGNNTVPLWICHVRESRAIGSLYFTWDDMAQSTVGSTTCNSGAGSPCTPVGYLQHWGRSGTGLNASLPLTLNGAIVGPLGGFGWFLNFDAGSPVSLKLTSMQISRQTHLFLAIPYPLGTSFVLHARAATWCTANTASKTCELDFSEVSSVAEVEASIGNVFHFDGSYLYLRVIQTPANYLGTPDWQLWDDVEMGSTAYPFIRDGISLPRFSSEQYVLITANCTPSATDASFCAELPEETSVPWPPECPTYFEMVGYDQCCPRNGSLSCIGPGGIATTRAGAYPHYVYPTPPSPPPSPSSPCIAQLGDCRDGGGCCDGQSETTAQISSSLLSSVSARPARRTRSRTLYPIA